jgi:hypothetical protein
MTKNNFLYQKWQFTYSYSFTKDVQDTGEAFTLQKRKSRTSKHEILNFFIFCGSFFALLDPDPDPEFGSGSTDLMIESGIRNAGFGSGPIKFEDSR